ncbi:NAD(P)/FAD-dependent oxidoreductase [Pseudonocardia acaciae]|uniref:NAD(P)/FAD-dependent oxidoreductase n=1 Tax=Pseudonocardia acaciae TaxID=551276 RepID=UPI00048EB0AB|nr:FAD-dependent oxidoreductase [Pseudonocardia acaciae]
MASVTVVGASLAGLGTARALRDQGFDGRVTVVGSEVHRPYDRPPLSKEFLAGTMARDELDLLSPEDEPLGVDWRLARTAVRLDPGGRSVWLDDGEPIASDAVVIATGSRARRLPGPPLAGVHTLRTVDDATALRAELVPGARLVLVGAGFIGAEIASTAAGLGVEVTVTEALATPLAGPLGVELGRVCAGLHGDHGVRLVAGVGVAELVGERRVSAVRLADGRELPADVVVVGIGARPCVDWLAGSGLALAPDGGVATDARCATAVPGVLAVGDCAAAHRDWAGGPLRLEHWTNALTQPNTAAATLLGRDDPLPPDHEAPYFWSDQYGHRLQFAGHRRDGDLVEVVEGDVDAREFLAVYRRGDQPVAVLGMNQPRQFTRWRRRLAARATTTATV